jgi:hypothetical protein
MPRAASALANATTPDLSDTDNNARRTATGQRA